MKDNKLLIKYYARLLQKGVKRDMDIPSNLRADVIRLAKTLPLREDMIEAKNQ